MADEETVPENGREAALREMTEATCELGLYKEKTIVEPWGARMGRLEAEDGGEVSAGNSIAAAFARDPFNNPPPCVRRPREACLGDCEHSLAGPCLREKANG